MLTKKLPAYLKIICFILLLLLRLNEKALSQSSPCVATPSRIDFIAGINPKFVAVGDIDGDGKPDMVVANSGSNTISIYRNISTSGSLTASSFAASVDFIASAEPNCIDLTDIDGDGKLDIVVANSTANTISLFRNTSTPGSITNSSLAARVDFATLTRPYYITCGDIDGDGKKDIIVGNIGTDVISIFQNVAVSGSITASSLANKIDFHAGPNPAWIVIRDMDLDGKPDVVYVNGFGLAVMRNIATPGSIALSSLENYVNFAAGNYAFAVAVGDLDGDGKPDVAVTNVNSSTVSIFQNTTTPGVINSSSFSANIEFPVGFHPPGVTIGDVNGDGKADVVVVNQYDNNVSTLLNTTAPGIINASSFAPATNSMVGIQPANAVIIDLNADGIPEIITANLGGSVSILQKTFSSSIPPVVVVPKDQSVFSNNASCSYLQRGTSLNASVTSSCVISAITYSLSGATINSSGALKSLDNVVFNSGLTIVNVLATDISGNSSKGSFSVTVSSSLNLSCANTNPHIYYGVDGFNSSNLVFTPSGGVGPYTITVTTNRNLLCNQVNSSGNESWVGGQGTTSNLNTICGSISGNPVTLAGSVSAGSSYSVTVSLLTDADITATITDVNGCSSTCTQHIIAEDARCFAGSSGISKVMMCHYTGSSKNPMTQICVDQSAVNAHLDKGDKLGNCNTVSGINLNSRSTLNAATSLEVSAVPNPTVDNFKIDIKSNSEGKVSIFVTDQVGRLIEKRIELNPNSTLQIGDKYSPGVYLVNIFQGKDRRIIKFIKLSK